MSILSAIQKVSNNIAAAYAKLDEKGATLPEVCDSSNLADTIESVPSGGGGEDFDVAAFNAAVSSMNSIMAIQSSSDSESARRTRLKNAGFTYNVGSNGDDTAMVCFVLQLSNKTKIFRIGTYTDSDFVYFRVADDVNVITSDGYGKTSYDRHSRSGSLYVTFDFTNSDSRTILLGINRFANFDPYGALHRIVEKGAGGGNYIVCGRDLRACHAYLNYADKYGNTSGNVGSTMFQYSGAKWWHRVRMLSCEQFNSNATRLSSLTINYNSLLVLNNNLIDTSFISQVFTSDVFDANLGVFKIMPFSDITSSGNIRSIFQYDACTNKDGKVPFIIDLTTGTSTDAITFGVYTSYLPNEITLPPRTMYIKLPSNRNVDTRIWVTTGNTSSLYTSLDLSLESWQYLATNAPTVSDKTLKVGDELYKLFTCGQTDYAAVLSTLTGKGWTVSAN